MSTDLSVTLGYGLSATLDGQGPWDAALIRLARSIVTQRQVIRARCFSLYSEWAKLPNVTLAQAVWLLLERDPLEVEQNQDKTLEHRAAVNRLDCEAGRDLKPIKPIIAGVPLRFHLEEVMRVARAVDVCADAAYVVSEFVAQDAPPPTLKSQRSLQRLDDRVNIHRRLIRELQSGIDKEVIVNGLPPKATPSSRRKNVGAPLNVQILGMKKEDYRLSFIKVFRNTFSDDNYDVPMSSINDDCAGLNIQFSGGRKKGSHDTTPRRRVSQAP